MAGIFRKSLNSDGLVSIQKASEAFGIHPDTLRDWESKGYIFAQRTVGGHRRYKIEDILKLSEVNETKPKLSIAERKIIIGQLETQNLMYEILEVQTGENYSGVIKENNIEINALQNGFERFYGLNWIEPDILLPEIEEEATDILLMFRIIKQSIEKLSSNELNKEQLEKLKFKGFQEEKEAKFFYYIYFLIQTVGHWQEFHNLDLKSTFEELPNYRIMLRKFNKFKTTSSTLNNFFLTKLQLIELAGQ